jgi:hypothetical protein
MQPATDYPSRLPRFEPPISLAELCEAEEYSKCAVAVRASLAPSLLSVRLFVWSHNRPTLLMPKSPDQKLLSYSLGALLRS